MSDFLELSVNPADPASHERLRLALDEQLRQERLSARRRRWMALVALTSVPLALRLALPHGLAPSLERAALALWATGWLGLLLSGLGERRSQRRLRALMGARDLSGRAGRG